MGISFLAPLFLVGLAALAAPIIIHLIQRERGRVVAFPSLMFLERIPYKSIRRQRIRHWLLLLLRLAALALLVAAFARPFLDRADVAGATGGGPGEIVILVDRSYSMAYGDRWERAVGAARRAVQDLGPDDRATLVYFASGATAEHRSSTDRARLLASLDTVAPGSGVTRYGPALKLAQSVLEQSELPRKEAILISDFQRNGWDGDEGVRFPEGAGLTPLSVASGEAPNLLVAAVSLQRQRFSGRDRITASARIATMGGADPGTVEVGLELDGRQLQAKTVELGSGGSASVTFEPFTLADPFTKGSVRLSADQLPRDDVFHFVASPADGLSVLVVESGAGRSGESLFLSRALEISEEPSFQVDVRRAEAVRASDLDGRAVVVLNGSRPPRGEAGRRLAEFVEEGGGLLVVLGERSAWAEDDPPLLPGSFGPPTDREEARGGTLGYVDYSHPVFELFRAPRSGDLTGARFYRYRPLVLEGTEGVLARYDNGSIALAERKVGKGRVLVWTSTLDNFWSDVALQPIFLPLVHQTTKYLAGFHEPTLWFQAEQVLNLSPSGEGVLDTASRQVLAGVGSDERVAVSPSGRPIPFGEGPRPGFLSLQEQGFYEFRIPGGSEARPPAVAVNVDLSESDLAPLDPTELTSSVVSRSTGTGTLAAAAQQLRPEDRERRQGIWWYLLVAAFFFLAIETAVSNRLSRKAA